MRGELMIEMTWRSPEALELLRDPRIVVHSTLTDRHDLSGDMKLYGRALLVEDKARLARGHHRSIKARTDWEPPQPYHVFAVDIEAAGWVTFGGPRFGLAWDAERGRRRWLQREA